MECKDGAHFFGRLGSKIRIVPEWNVKLQVVNVLCQGVFIRIVPEWNVKKHQANNQTKQYSIRIVPEWNVKVLESSFDRWNRQD